MSDIVLYDLDITTDIRKILNKTMSDIMVLISQIELLKPVI